MSRTPRVRRERDAARLLRPEHGAVPPHDLDAEAAVLSSVLLEPSVYEEELSGTLDGKHFYSEANRRIYEVIAALIAAHEVPDIVSVAGRLKDTGRLAQIGGTPYLAQLADATPAHARLGQLVRRLIDRWRRRELIASSQIVAAEAYVLSEETSSTQELLQKFSLEVTELAYAAGKHGGLIRIDGGLILDDALAAARNINQPTSGVPTGFRRVDNKIGSLRPGELHIVAGRPGIGKTQYALNMCQNVAEISRQRRPAVALFELEMPRQQLGQRWLATNSGIDLSRLLRGHIHHHEHNALADGAARLGPLQIYVDDEPGVTPLDVYSRAVRLQRKLLQEEDAELALVVIDYLQIMRASRELSQREQEISSMTAELKMHAKQLGVPVVALSQLNREVEKRPDRRPRISDLRESGAIEQDADCIHLLYRDEYYHEDTSEPGVLEVNIAKQRNGPVGVVKLAFRQQTGLICDLATESQDEADEYSDFDEARW